MLEEIRRPPLVPDTTALGKLFSFSVLCSPGLKIFVTKIASGVKDLRGFEQGTWLGGSIAIVQVRFLSSLQLTPL